MRSSCEAGKEQGQVLVGQVAGERPRSRRIAFRSAAKLTACRSLGFLRNSGRLVLSTKIRRFSAGAEKKRRLFMSYLARSSSVRAA